MNNDPKPAEQPERVPMLGGRPGGPIRISMPASIAYDLLSFQNSIASVQKYLGCPTCCSGHDITFGMEREFVLNEKQELRASGSTQIATHEPIPTANTVTVTIPHSVNYNLDQVREVVARVAARLGCGQCHSGYDLRFRQELEFVVDQNLNVRTAGQGF